MTIENIAFSCLNWGEFGQRRIKITLTPNEQRRINFSVPAGFWMLIIKLRFGDITANTLQFKWDNVRNAWEELLTIGTELLNFETEPFPYIVVSGNKGAIVIRNTTSSSQNFEMTYDFVLIPKEIAGKIRELIFKKREEFKGEIAYQ